MVAWDSLARRIRQSALALYSAVSRAMNAAHLAGATGPGIGLWRALFPDQIVRLLPEYPDQVRPQAAL